MTLLPSPLVLLYTPGVNDVAHKVQSIAGIVFEKIVQLVRLTIFGA
jgi:hypothetical protein